MQSTPRFSGPATFRHVIGAAYAFTPYGRHA
jgi:hypothetical protein